MKNNEKLAKGAVTSVVMVALAVCGWAAQKPPVGDRVIARVALERLAGDAARTNDVMQFLGADAKGRVFLLHGDNLAVDQILPSGKIVSWRKPQVKEGTDAEVSDDALSPDGSSWFLASGSDELRLLTADDLHQLPTTPWRVSALTYTTDGPVLAVLPMKASGRDAATEEGWDKPPFLQRLDGQRWHTLSAQEEVKLIAEEPPVIPSLEQVRGEREVKLAAGPHGSLWAAQQNAYLLKRYSSSGKLVDTVAV